MTVSAVAQLAEEHFLNSSYDRRQLYEDLKAAHNADPSDVDVAWRFVRAAYQASMLKAVSVADQKRIVNEGLEVIKKTVEIADDNADVHNFYGVILSRVGDLEGIKVQIANSFLMKGHWEKSVQLDPSKAVTYHFLGSWCEKVADLSWFERKAAAALFGTPPESTYEEALKNLLKCDELRGNDAWKKNTTAIAQVYFKLKNKDEARKWADKALALPVRSEEDQTAHDEAQALRKKL